MEGNPVVCEAKERRVYGVSCTCVTGPPLSKSVCVCVCVRGGGGGGMGVVGCGMVV